MIEPSATKANFKKSLGFSKIRTDTFLEKKREILLKKERFRSNANRDGDKSKYMQKDDNSVSIQIGTTGGLPPVWVDYYEDTLKKLKDLERITQETAKLINSRLKMQFGDHSDLDNQINQKGNQAMQILQDCGENHKKIQKSGLNSNESASDKRIRDNVEKILATQIQQWTVTVRKQQKTLLDRVKEVGDTGVKDNGHLASTDYSEEARQEMEAMEDIARERDEDVNRLIDTINELSHLFKQMNHLVIEQGTLVDRIDYNLENAVIHIDKGKKELRKAVQYQSSKCGSHCIKILVIMNAIFTLLLLLKFAHR